MLIGGTKWGWVGRGVETWAEIRDQMLNCLGHPGPLGGKALLND